MTAKETGVRISRIWKDFGSRRVLHDASLAIEAGRVTALLGPNGAGKTTFVAIATGRLGPDAGRVSVAGLSPDSRGFAAVVGCAPQDTGVYPTLTLRQNLASFAELYGLRRGAARARVDELLSALDLETVADRRADQLSGGQRRRLHTAMALVHRPAALFLDEPTVAADLTSRARIVDLVRSLADDGAAVLYTTHHLDEVERLAADVAFLHDGRIRDLGPVEDVVARWGTAEVALRVATDEPFAASPAWRWAGEWLVGSADGADPGRLLAQGIAEVTANAARIVEVDIRRSSLETAYLHLLQAGDANTREADDVAA
ncbi:ABC transporter ATP-binding protein [Microbacterium arborescens]|uniref:ABC transporter ATP-binding protein n=1 Tax=Microbacterium arborescens TaxID=33883 RepID=UPI00278835B8|nr:ABC transporter ATP-binding protein [Microbacterium arborescens]MDQ1216672.1 ABC-2 type transport system ATP-binding protein [Microbacterium arborescens]